MYIVLKINPNKSNLIEENMSITKKFLSALTATICAATACVCSVPVSAEIVSETRTYEYLEYVAVDRDNNGTEDFARITGCSDTTSVLIPGVINGLIVEEIIDGAFIKNSTLERITVEDNNKFFTAKDGILFNADSTEIICYPSAKITATQYSIPSTVTEIAGYAFYNCAKMTDITIPNSTVEIGNRAFYGCEPLANVTIPSTVTSVGARAFDGTKLLNDQDGPLYYADTWLIYCDYNVSTIKEDSTNKRYCRRCILRLFIT